MLRLGVSPTIHLFNNQADACRSEQEQSSIINIKLPFWCSSSSVCKSELTLAVTEYEVGDVQTSQLIDAISVEQ